MLGELFFLGVLILVLHQISSRLGLNPLIFMLGSLAAILQFRNLGFVSIILAGEAMKISVGSYVILPIILMGFLVIYIVNGSTQARNTSLGLILVSFLVALFQFLPALPGMWFANFTAATLQSPTQARIPLSSLATLIVDIAVLVTVYQALSNWRGQFPSRFASGIALIAALWSDALIFPILAYAGTPVFSTRYP